MARLKPEIDIAYCKLRRYWPGQIRRSKPMYDKGRPDFELIYQRHITLAEIKSCESVDRQVDLSETQVIYLNEADKYRDVCCLVYIPITGEWRIFLPPINMPIWARDGRIIDISKGEL